VNSSITPKFLGRAVQECSSVVQHSGRKHFSTSKNFKVTTAARCEVEKLLAIFLLHYMSLKQLILQLRR